MCRHLDRRSLDVLGAESPEQENAAGTWPTLLQSHAVGLPLLDRVHQCCRQLSERGPHALRGVSGGKAAEACTHRETGYTWKATSAGWRWGTGASTCLPASLCCPRGAPPTPVPAQVRGWRSSCSQSDALFLKPRGQDPVSSTGEGCEPSDPSPSPILHPVGWDPPGHPRQHFRTRVGRENGHFLHSHLSTASWAAAAPRQAQAGGWPGLGTPLVCSSASGHWCDQFLTLTVPSGISG